MYIILKLSFFISNNIKIDFYWIKIQLIKIFFILYYSKNLLNCAKKKKKAYEFLFLLKRWKICGKNSKKPLIQRFILFDKIKLIF